MTKPILTKPIRYFELCTDGSIVLYPEPFTNQSGSCSIEYGKTLSEVRRLYSKFDLKPIWEEA